MNLPYILAHFIGDFALQNDWMALGKKRSNLICTTHVLLYMLPFLLVKITIMQFILIGIEHWIQDRTRFISWYCKSMGSFQGELKQPGLPWGHFVVDQVFHFIWMFMVMKYVQ